MTASKDLPNAGYNLTKVYFPEQTLRVVELDENTPEQPRFQFGWDWKRADQEHFEVSLVFDISASRGRPEETRVVVCGIFKPVGAQASVTLTEFVRLQGPAILFPYAREAISSLTSRGFFDAIHLPALNILRMMADLDPSATTGAQQLKEEEVKIVSDPSRSAPSTRSGKQTARKPSRRAGK